MKINRTLSKAGLSGLLLLGSLSAANAVVLYISPPKQIGSEIKTVHPANFIEETFTELAGPNFPARDANWTLNTGYSAPSGIGTYTALAGSVRNSSSTIYSTGPGNPYNTVRDAGGLMRLDLTSSLGSVHYFGMNWNAMDADDVITLLDVNGDILPGGQFSTAWVLDNIFNTGNPTVTALNGNSYNVSDYLGRPIGGQNPDEYYFYFHVVSNDIAIHAVTFSNGNVATQYETDNHTIVGGTTVGPVPEEWVVIPEPSTYAMLIGLVGLAFAAYRRRK